MAQIYDLKHYRSLSKGATNKNLTYFIEESQRENSEYPDVQSLDAAWQLSKSESTDAKLRQLVVPTIEKLRKQKQERMNTKPEERKHEGVASHLVMTYQKHWLRGIKDSSHFPMDIRALAADLLGEKVVSD